MPREPLPKTMRALLVSADKTPVFTTIPTPPDHNNESMVLVRVYSASLSPLTLSHPGGPATYDISGTVVCFTGDAFYYNAPVITIYRGILSDYILCPSSSLTKKPAILTHIEASGVPTAGTVALQALLQLGSRKRVLITGGKGAVGWLAAQMAGRVTGATEVYVVVREEDIAATKPRLGDRAMVIPYKVALPRYKGRWVDGIVDTKNMGANLMGMLMKESGRGLMKNPRGMLVGVGVDGVAIAKARMAAAWCGLGWTEGFKVQGIDDDSGKALSQVAGYFDMGTIRAPEVGRVLEWGSVEEDEIREAWKELKEGRAKGKTVIRFVVDPPQEW